MAKISDSKPDNEGSTPSRRAKHLFYLNYAFAVRHSIYIKIKLWKIN